MAVIVEADRSPAEVGLSASLAISKERGLKEKTKPGPSGVDLANIKCTTATVRG